MAAVITDEEFGELFHQAHRSARRLETRDRYDVVSEHEREYPCPLTATKALSNLMLTSSGASAFIWGSSSLHIASTEQCLKPVDVDDREGRTFPVIE